MFILCTRKFAIMTPPRCGHTNMYHYFGIQQHSDTGFHTEDWKQHPNPILVLRNPLDRVASSLELFNTLTPTKVHRHSCPYMHYLRKCNFRIIDFYDLEQYIPRSNLMQSWRSDTRLDDTVTAEDVYLPNNTVYTLEELQQEVENYKQLMLTRERISVEEWKNLTES